MSSIHHLSVKQLLQAADLKERIAGLENQLEYAINRGTHRYPQAHHQGEIPG